MACVDGFEEREMRGLRLTAVMLVAAVAFSCVGGGRGTEEGPAFEASLWDGRVIEGEITWGADGRVTVGGERVAADGIRSIATAEREESAAVVVEELPEGFGPLTAEELVAYKARADEAAERHAGVDAVFCLDRGENILLPDGGSIYRYHALFLILKESARGHANISLGFTEGRSRSRVLFARTIDAEGEMKWAEAGAFTESVPPQEAQFFDKRRRVLSGQAPGADVGVFVEYAYEYVDYEPEIKDFFFPGYFFQSDIPVLDSVIEIMVPAGRALNFTTRNMPEEAIEPLRFEREGCDGYRWEMSDLAPLEGEPYMPARGDVVPSVHVSLYFDWAAFMEPTGKFQSERVEVTDEIAALAAELTEGKETDDEKAAAIYHWVQRNINYLSIKASLSSGWAGHPAGETLKNGYGDCTDVSNLVSSLCRAVGIEAYPAVLRTNDSGTAVRDIPTPDANPAIALIYPDGKPRFVDPTTTDYRYPYFRSDDHGVKAVIYMKGELMDIPVGPPEENLRASELEIEILADGGALMSERNTYTGPYEAGVRGYWRSVPPEMRERVMQQYLQQRIPGAALAGFELSDMENLDEQLWMVIESRVPTVGTKVRDLFIFGVPGFEQEFGETTLSARRFDIVMRTSHAFRTVAEVRLPEGYEVAGIPEDITVEGEHLSFAGSVRETDDGRGLTVRKDFARLTRVVPVEDYAGYRKDAAAIAAWTDLKIVLKRVEVEAEGAGDEAGVVEEVAPAEEAAK